MNFFSQIFSSIQQFLSGMVSRVVSFFTNLYRKIEQPIKNFRQFLEEKIRAVLVKPSKKEDYVKFGASYYAKKFLIMGVLILVGTVYFIGWYAYPWAEGKLWYAVIEYESPKHRAGFSGKVKMYDKGRFIYEGGMSSGKFSGYGKQYDENNNLIYEGNFENNVYQGAGKYYEEKVLRYSGQFAEDKFNGLGDLYNSNGKLVYSGNFSSGQKSGNGIEYFPNTGRPKHVGEFSSDLRHGQGVEYEEDGKTIKYKGEFANGVYEGQGKYLEKNKLLYEGEFKGGKYNGTGKFYDTATGKIIYEGEFSEGMYSGKGKLYDINTEKLTYEGNFDKGKKKGAGILYDQLGSKIYTGDFSEDDIDYVSLLGAKLSDFEAVKAPLGHPSFKKENSGKQVLTYLSKNTSVIFEENPEKKGEFLSSKFIIRMKSSFRSLTSKSNSVKIEQIMGKPYSSISYNFDSYYNKIFSDLDIKLTSKEPVPSDRFTYDGYFIRFYYNNAKDEILAVEIAK